MEEELRKQEKLRGTPILLGNGEEWIISSLPLSDEGERIAQSLEDMAAKEDGGMKRKESIALYFSFMYALTVANYPALIEDDARKAGLFQIDMVEEFVEAMTGTPKKA